MRSSRPARWCRATTRRSCSPMRAWCSSRTCSPAASAADLQPRRHLAEMRARRRQAQRPGECRLHRPPPHLLRDAGQFLLRRLLQGPRHRARLEPGDARIRPAGGPAAGHRLCRGRRGGGALAENCGPAGEPHPAHPDLGQFLGDGRHRPLRPLLGNLLRPWRPYSRRPARQPGRGRRPVHRDLEPGLHAVRAGDAGGAHFAAQPLHRHRHGAGAARRRAAGQARQLRHRPDAGADPGVRRGLRRGRGRARTPSRTG